MHGRHNPGQLQSKANRGGCASSMPALQPTRLCGAALSVAGIDVAKYVDICCRTGARCPSVSGHQTASGWKALVSGCLAVEAFERYVRRHGSANYLAAARKELGGMNLACWCRLCPAHAAGKPLGVQCDACEPGP